MKKKIKRVKVPQKNPVGRPSIYNDEMKMLSIRIPCKVLAHFDGYSIQKQPFIIAAMQNRMSADLALSGKTVSKKK